MQTFVQAGAVAFRKDGGEPQVLLVTSRRNPTHWIFPKGHVDPGEALEEAALREAYEEAGVDGAIAGSAKTVAFVLDGRRYRVHYFPVAAYTDGWPREGRKLAWCSRGDALARLAFDGNRRLLRSLWPEIEAWLAGSARGPRA